MKLIRDRILTMNITHENIIGLIFDPESRSDLLKAIALQNDNSLNIENAVSDAILNLKAIAKSDKTFYLQLNYGKFGSL